MLKSRGKKKPALPPSHNADTLRSVPRQGARVRRTKPSCVFLTDHEKAALYRRVELNTAPRLAGNQWCPGAWALGMWPASDKGASVRGRWWMEQTGNTSRSRGRRPGPRSSRPRRFIRPACGRLSHWGHAFGSALHRLESPAPRGDRLDRGGGDGEREGVSESGAGGEGRGDRAVVCVGAVAVDGGRPCAGGGAGASRIGAVLRLSAWRRR